MAIDAVIFDIGNVLLRWDPVVYYDARIGAERRRALYDAVDLDGMNLEVDRGAPLSASVEALAADHPEWQDEIRMWRDNWLDMAPGLIEGSVRLLRALRARGVPVHALSNFGRETFEIARAAYPVLDEFDSRYVSAHLGTIKPEPEIYALLEAGTGLSGAALLFIDDKPENIAAAEARGWLGHVFDGPEGLARRLVAEGLLPGDMAGG